MILSIDPGYTESAFVVFDGVRPFPFGKWDNRALLREIHVGTNFAGIGRCAIETLKPRGMPVAFETMQTQLWAGRFYEAWYQRQGGDKFALSEPDQAFRDEVKLHICGSRTAKDSNIRQALIDRFGGEANAIGGKKCPRCGGKGWFGRDRHPCPCSQAHTGWLHPPGPLYGVSSDVWAALAIATYWWDTKRESLTPNPESE